MTAAMVAGRPPLPFVTVDRSTATDAAGSGSAIAADDRRGAGSNTAAAATLPLLSIDGSTQLTEVVVEPPVSVAVLASWVWSRCQWRCWRAPAAEPV